MPSCMDRLNGGHMQQVECLDVFQEICQQVVFRELNQAAASVCLIPSMNWIP
jgi:hypothetical protein